MTKRSISVLVLAALLAACAANGGGRAPFDDDQSNDSTTPGGGKPPAPPPAKTTDEGPLPPPPGDASLPETGPACTPTTPSSKCGLVPQCGCTLAETCDISDAAGNSACVTAGTATMGKPCTTTAGCAVGLTCVFGTCHQFCDDTSKACSGTGVGSCINVQNGGPTPAPIPHFDVCLVKCDLRDANACGGTTAAGTGACVADDKGNTDCEKTTGNKAENATGCTTDCAPGLVCVGITVGATTTNTCKRWCQVGTTDCGAGKTCGGFSTKMMVDGKEYGACP